MDENVLNVMMDLLHEVFDPSLPGLGPADAASTRRALALVASREPRRILDLGCGNGRQTLLLAEAFPQASIVALDNHEPFLDELARRAAEAGVSERIELLQRDMREMDFPAASFDLVWSEGAIFVIGFREGVAACHEILAPGGCLGLTELTWFKAGAPDECREFFESEYAPMTDVHTNLESISRAGYHILEHFSLPESAWRDNYFAHVEPRLAVLRDRYEGDSAKLAFLEIMQKEIDIYRKYSEYYGYEFFIAALA